MSKYLEEYVIYNQYKVIKKYDKRCQSIIYSDRITAMQGKYYND